jgi:hypothetical protein
MIHKAETFPPVTMGHIRGHGCRDLLVYCDSGRCHHSATLTGDRFPDDLPVRSLCRRMVCTVCGMIGADVRPDWSPHVTDFPQKEGTPAGKLYRGSNFATLPDSGLDGAARPQAILAVALLFPARTKDRPRREKFGPPMRFE